MNFQIDTKYIAIFLVFMKFREHFNFRYIKKKNVLFNFRYFVLTVSTTKK